MMRKEILLGMLLFTFSCSGAKKKENAITFEPDPNTIQIVLFHLTQRCESCIAVEAETQTILEAEYKKEMDSGKIRFISYDFHSENGKKAAGQLMASGQTLYVVKGDSISDLTGPAFLFAHTHPERYRDALTKELDKYLK